MATLPTEYFQQLYRDDADPWRISGSWYEERKRALVMAALPSAHYSTAFEPGCGNGDLTVLLAERCTHVIAWDAIDAAVARTRERTADHPGVETHVGSIPDFWPDGTADLVVLSELGYYFDEDDLARIVVAAVDHLEPAGTLLAVHWRHDAPDYPLRGDDVHASIAAVAALESLAEYRDEDVRLGVWTRGPAPSVARAAGLL